jgi:hypothetical protein
MLWDVLTWVAVFLLGGLIALVAGAIFIAAIYFLQNGGKDD